MKSQVLFDKWWGIGVSLFVIFFLGGFLVDQFEGVITFAELLWNATLAIPTSITTVFDYYGSTPLSVTGASLLVGGVFGAVLTVLVVVSVRNIAPLPGLSAPALWVGLLTGAGAYLLRGSLLSILGAAVGGALLSGLVLQPDMRRFFSAETARHLLLPFGRRSLLLAVGVGAAAGAVGSQVLAYPTRHCTYLAEAPYVEQQLGYLLTMVSALVLLVPVWTLLQPRRISRTTATAGHFKGWLLPVLFLMPSLVSLFVFLYYPAIQITTLSLSIQRFRREAFYCLGNYVDLANDVIYRNSFLTTLSLTVGIVSLCMILALGIAVLASQKVRGASIYRTLLIWPYAISPVVTGSIFLTMFRQGNTGLINYFLSQTLNITPEWLTDRILAPWVIIFASVWNALGFNILFYIAGLQNIPKDLLEAAQIDGANRLQRFVRITLPLLSPFSFFLLVSNVTFSFYGIYGVVDTLTQGGPPIGPAGRDGRATNVLIYKLYEEAFAPGAQIGGAAAQSVLLFVLVAIVTLLQFRYLERRITYSD